MDAAQAAKGKAMEAAEQGDYATAIDYLTESLRNQFSNLTLCRRAEYLLKLPTPRPNACIHDCSYALNNNPDSAKALKIRGRAYAYESSVELTDRMMEKWLEAAADLRRACAIDFDEETDKLRKEVDEKAHEIESRIRAAEIAKQEAEERAKEERAKAYRERVMK